MSDKAHLPFDRFRANVHSQNGEDGVIEEIFNRLEVDNGSHRWCVEFGAWDGIHLSNTFALVENGWNAVYIEGDASRFQDLLNTANKFPLIVPVNAFVAPNREDEHSLDSLLGQTRIPREYDLLSIDIDSYDLDVWETVTNYSPKVVIIEINSSVPPGIVWRHTSKTQGNTFSATLNVGIQKRYTLVCHTGNLIFVRDDLMARINMDARYVKYPELLFEFESPWFSKNLFTSQPSRVLKIIRRILRSKEAPEKWSGE